MSRKTYDLTQGSITRQLIAFAVPLLFGAVVQMMYSTVDMMFVGRELGTKAAAAVGSSNMIINCIIGFFTGLSVGVGVVVGTSVGGRDYDKLRRVIRCAAALTIVMGVVFTAASLILSPKILAWMRTPEDILPEATTYIRIYMCSMIAIVSYNVGTGILKALGDSRSPTLYQLFGGIANVAGNYLFIVVFRWGIVGAAMTTLLSQTMAAALTAAHLFRLPEGYRLKLREIRLEWGLSVEILSVGIPSAIQAIMISLSNMVVQANINKLSVSSIAAFAAYYKVDNIMYYPVMAVSAACAAFVSQNVGAGRLDRVRGGIRRSLQLGVAVAVVTSVFTVIIAEYAFSLFSKDPEVISIGVQMGRLAYSFYFIYVFLEVYAAAIRGAGKAFPTMVITIFNMCFVRYFILMALMNRFHTAVGVVAVYPITWLITAASLGIYYRSGRWVPEKLKKSQVE